MAGYFLLAAGFLGGAFVSSMTEANEVAWRWFLPAFGVGVAGVLLAWIGRRRVAREEGVQTDNMDLLRGSLERIVERITQLDQEKERLHPYDLHGRIDELFPAELSAFVDARQSIVHRHGLQAYAAVMNEFAAGERYLNRVWSASVDCYVDDAREYLGRSREQFVKARDLLAAL